MRSLALLIFIFNSIATVIAANDKYVGVPLATALTNEVHTCYGVPFVQGPLPLEQGGSAKVTVGAHVERILLLGMTDQISERERTGGSRRAPSEIIRPAVPVDAWTDPLNQSTRFWVGDKLGEIRLDYADGTTQVYPLILGQSVWWGRIFYDYPKPFDSDPELRKAFSSALRLYPPRPVADGNYIAVIEPKNVLLKSITFEVSAAKKGTIGIRGMTLETADTNEDVSGMALPPASPSPDLARFIETRPLLLLGRDDARTQHQLQNLRLALYSTEKDFKGPVAASLPSGYSGPHVSFKGDLTADILTEAFYYNVQDIRDKIDSEGMYHTSTKDALSWGGYKGIGTFREKLGRYYDVAYSRTWAEVFRRLRCSDTRTTRCAAPIGPCKWPTSARLIRAWR
jgi:hypothetical protein